MGDILTILDGSWLKCKMGGGKMFNGNVENIQLTRQLFASVALKIAEVWITEDKIFLFYPGNYAYI